MKSNAQSSLEFMILSGAAILFFIGIIMAIHLNIADKNKENLNREIKKIALTVQEEINLAIKSKDGYQRQFNLPEKAIQKEYAVNITEGLIYVKTADNKEAIAFPVANVTGQPIIGTNTIMKFNGTVYLNTLP